MLPVVMQIGKYIRVLWTRVGSVAGRARRKRHSFGAAGAANSWADVIT